MKKYLFLHEHTNFFFPFRKSIYLVEWLFAEKYFSFIFENFLFKIDENPKEFEMEIGNMPTTERRRKQSDVLGWKILYL